MGPLVAVIPKPITRLQLWLFAASMAVVLSACGGQVPSITVTPTSTALPAPTDTEPSPSNSGDASPGAGALVAPAPIARGQLQLTCGSPLGFAPRALLGPSGVETADHPAAAALRQYLGDNSPVPPRPGWRVVVLSETHALFLLPGLPAEGVSFWNVEFENRAGAWSYVRSGQCELQPVFEGVGPASWELATGFELRADTTTLQVLVTELGCSSGRSPQGRVVPAAVIYEADSVTVIFGVKPLPGAQTCQSARPTAVSLDLREALGRRALLDGSVFPPEARGRAP